MRALHISFLFLVLIIGCASQPTPKPFYIRIYDGSFDEVWPAALRALSDYPLKISNKDTGLIESELVNGPYNDLTFVYPERIELPERFRYSIGLNFAKFEGSDRKPLTRIRIMKKLERFQDFYTGWTSFPSDGLEERVLLYRIEHVLQMEKLLTHQGYGDK
jgi:hypothetical protein